VCVIVCVHIDRRDHPSDTPVHVDRRDHQSSQKPALEPFVLQCVAVYCTVRTKLCIINSLESELMSEQLFSSDERAVTFK